MAKIKMTVQKQPQRVLTLPKMSRFQLMRGLNAAAQWFAGEVKENYLSGQVLNVRSDRLRSSITFRGVSTPWSEMEAAVGTNVEYARIHEYGGGIGRQTSWRSGGSRVINMPERSYLRRGLKENAKKIRNIVAKSINVLLRP